MHEDRREKDARDLWRDQPEEELPVTLSQFVNRRSEEMHSGTRSEILLSIGAALFFVTVIAWRFWPIDDRLLQLGFFAVIAWVAITLFRFRNRIRREGGSSTDTLAAPGLDHYRKELEQRRDHLRNSWLWHGPLLLACIILVGIIARKMFPGYGQLQRALPLIGLLVVWVGFGVMRRRRQSNDLRQEIRELELLDGNAVAREPPERS